MKSKWNPAGHYHRRVSKVIRHTDGVWLALDGKGNPLATFGDVFAETLLKISHNEVEHRSGPSVPGPVLPDNVNLGGTPRRKKSVKNNVTNILTASAGVVE